MSAIYIMWLRQLKRYVRSRSRIIGALGQPILYLLALGYGFGQVFKAAGQGNYIQFLAPGIISMSVLFTSMFNGVEMIWDRQFGFLKETMVAPVSRFNVMLGRIAGGATVATIQGLIVFILSFVVGFRLHTANPVSVVVLAVVFMFLLALMFTTLGTAIAAMLTDFQGFQLIMSFVVMPVYFLSGAIFPLVGLPKALTIITHIDPLTYGVDALRSVLIGVSHFNLWTDFGIIGALIVILLGICSYLFSKIQI